jgi:hypothetical protein
MEKRTTKLGLLGTAAVILSSALAGPTMAQQVIDYPSRCAAVHSNANCQNLGPGNPYIGSSYQRRVAYRHSVDRNPNGNADNWNDGWHDSWNDANAPCP